MFLFWGDQLLCFYNDAFRPSLGAEGKHPALGKKGKEVWPEIWEFIGPLIEQVLATGEPVWYETQLVPFYRNGKIESIYWTFSYSPAYGDKGEINGVFVTCTETTKGVNTLQQLEESESLLRNMVEQAPVAITLTRGEEMVIESINAPMLRLMNKNSRENVLGKKLVGVLPEVEGQPVLQIVKNVLLTGEAFKGDEIPVSMMADGKMKQYYLDLSYTPVIEKGIPTAVLHVAIDVTDKVLSRKKVWESEKNLRSIIYNLLSNAIKYHSPQRIPQVQITCQARGEYLVLSVQDNGLGIEAGRMSQLFTIFKRLHDHVEGSGIGLYMIKKMVENTGGRIEVESQVGVGSTFRVFFPS